MSIIINNISEEYSRDGEQLYEVRINDIQLSTFTHYSPDGMATCLIKAAKSIAEVDIDGRISEERRKKISNLRNQFITQLL